MKYYHRVTALRSRDTAPISFKLTTRKLLEIEGDNTIIDVQLELRDLSSMTEEECNELDWNYKFHNSDEKINHEPENLNPNEFIYLLSKGFDIFQLKEKGLAIYPE